MKKASFLPLALLGLWACNPTSGDTVNNNQKGFSIPYEKFVLDNGLEVILHEDHSDPIVAVATMIHVGSNREKPGKTGFAHFFEHMSFNDSENAPVGANRKLIPEWGGLRNGGTWSDGTVYYEVVPKDAFDKILWIDSDRLGYMINTVTEAALAREIQVVKNEKRQRVDNSPYGYTDEIIRKNLYPEGHPYSWTVIGSLPDLQAATIEDVKEFYHDYYGPNNASLVIAGDIDIEETKKKVKLWFGEIKKGPEVSPLPPMPVSLTESQNLAFEDEFAKLPELTMVFPTVENYNEDIYALEILGQLLSGSKKAPLYKLLVEEKKLTPRVSTYQRGMELAGEFTIRVRANAGTDLDSVKAAILTGLNQFEQNGFDESELKRIKAELETNLYQGISTVLNKAFTLVQDNEFKGDPTHVIEAAKKTNQVTKEDVMRVYNTYIKDQPYLMTSVVPQSQMNLSVTDAQLAEVWKEEIIPGKANEEVSQGAEAEYEKTVTVHDRSEPDFGEMPLFETPNIWTSELANGMNVYGIENNETPLVEFSITIDGGHSIESIDKAGTARLMASLMQQGTAQKTPAELEEAIGLLGASIYISADNEDITINASCLSKNFEATLALVEEMLLEPRWDATEFDRLKQATLTNIKGAEANATTVAYYNFNRLLYGTDHIFGYPSIGTAESVSALTLEDLKAFYNNLGSNIANFHLVGDMQKANVLTALEELNTKWNKEVTLTQPAVELPTESKAGQVYFIDVPAAKQSVIYMGNLAVSSSNPVHNNISFANEIIGGGISGELAQVLRIQKGYTYGAYSSIRNSKEVAPYIASTSVRANATLPSLQTIEDIVKTYHNDFNEEYVKTTQNKVLKNNTRAYESLGAKLGILRSISKYGHNINYLEDGQNELLAMTVDNFKEVIAEYINEEEMMYLVVGDAATQFKEVQQFKGKNVIQLDIYGNVIQP